MNSVDEHHDEQRGPHRGRHRDLRRILLHQLVDRGGHHVVAVRQAEHERGRERAEHLGEHEHRGAEHARQHQRQRDAQHGAQPARAHHLRGFLQRRIHRLHHGADHHEGDRALEQRHHPGDAVGRVDVDQVLLAAERAEDLVEEAALRRAEQAPGERAEQRREIVRHHHHLLEEAAARHVGTGDDPRHHEAEHQRHHGGGDRHGERVEDDLRVFEQAGEIIQAVAGRRPRLRIAGIERGLQQESDRIEHEQARRQRDQRTGGGLG